MDKNLKGKLIIINVSEIIHIVMSKVWIIVAVAVVFGTLGATYAGISARSGVPMYKATAKLYMSGGTASVTASSITLGQAVIPNYMEIVESRPVLESVIANLGLNMTTAELKRCISDTTPSGTNMLWISVVFPDAEWAKRVTDELVIESASYALEIMGCVPPIVYEEASVPTSAYNMVSASFVMYGALGACVGIAVAGGLLLMCYFLNNKFDSPAKVDDRLRVKLRAFIARNDNGEGKPTAAQACEHFIDSLYADGVQAKVLAFSSVTDGECRDEVVKSFANELCNYGKSVLILDLAGDSVDKEGTSLTGYVDFVQGKCGFESMILKEEGCADKVVRGNSKGFIGEMYGDERFDEVIAQFEELYDYVFVNVPALDMHREAMLIAKKVGNVVIVLSALNSKIAKCKKQRELFVEQDVSVLGAVLGDVEVQNNRYFEKTYKLFLQ